jgi:hypothetical protein
MMNIRQEKIKDTDRVGFFTHKGSEIRILQSALNSVKNDAGMKLSDLKNYLPESTSEFFSHMLLEMSASILITYSAFYMPPSEQDYLKQYVSSLCIFAIVVSLKDSHYFFPDGTPQVTLILWAATLYTEENGTTKWADICSRVLGQLIGWGGVFWMATANKDNIIQYADLPHHHSPLWLHSINEGLSTMIECIAIAFAVIPIMAPYPRSSTRNLIQSKSEARPPTNSTLAATALSLAIIHYSLEQTFQSTMNPFNTIIHFYMQEEKQAPENWWAPIVFQIIGVIVACIYIHLYRPSDYTLNMLRTKCT